jgi:diguanylate cyclase (GGDEF)-like protein/PAS domain S-box-containing protein
MTKIAHHMSIAESALAAIATKRGAEREFARPKTEVGATSSARAEAPVARASPALADDHLRLALILEATQAGTWEWNIPTGEVQCNERWAEMLGYTLTELSPLSISTWDEHMHTPDRAHARALLGKHFSRNVSHYDFEARMRHKDGRWIWVHCQGRVVNWTSRGKPLTMFGITLDISRRKEAERRLRESESFLDRTGRVAGVGGWEIDLTSRELTWSDETCRLHELPLGHRPTLDEAVGYFAPEARPRVEAAIQACIVDGKGWDLELPLTTATGRHIWVRLSGSAEFEDGRARWVVGAIQNITVRRKAVKALEVSEQRFRHLFEHSLGLICTHDLDGIILSVNTAAARSLGYTLADLVGRRMTDFMRPERHAAFHDYLARLQSNGSDSGLLELVARDESLRTWQYHNAIDQRGTNPYVLGNAQDISDRQRLEGQLRTLATRDPLTNCHNRRYLAKLSASMKKDDTWGCITVDLDKFKRINDTFGHTRGDAVLVEMGRFLSRHLRADDVVVRTGGDEFLVLLAHGDDEFTAQICSRITQDRESAPIAFTLGYAVAGRGRSLDDALGLADKRLYATRAGKTAS